MVRLLFLSSFVLALAAHGVGRASNPDANALRQQVKALRAEEKVVVKVIKARYTAVIKRGELTEKELVAERVALRQQEKLQIKQVTTLYKAKIAELNNLIRVAEKAGSKKR